MAIAANRMNFNFLTILSAVVVMVVLALVSVVGFKGHAPAQKEPAIKTASQRWSDALYFKANGDDSQAIWEFRQYIDSGGENKEVYLFLSELYVKTGQLNQALASAQESVLRGASRVSSGYFQLGVVYSLLGQKEKAVESYSKSVESDPTMSEAYFNLGYIYESDNQFSKAIESYKKTLVLDDKHAKAYYNLANIYAGMDSLDDAIAMYKKAVEFDRNYMDAFVNLSIVLTKTGDFKGALANLDEAILLGYQAPEEYQKTLEVYREKKSN